MAHQLSHVNVFNGGKRCLQCWIPGHMGSPLG
ncbi:hypothetical protein CGMCC3_g16655 [Colletotrichum fructicola]|nr:uncharacterized protein CGMCC3_g16655 [Colletotrichum fructicola]KAE9567195.1 hypothetical protein CGMCC3_g16655 [Colletotrichum fructicola]